MDESTSLRGGQCRPPLVAASTIEMDQLAFEASSALDAASRAIQTTIDRYRDAGLALSKAKAQCKHGDWLPWLKRHRIAQPAASRAMRVADNYEKLIGATNLDEALAGLATHQEAEEPQAVASTGFFDVDAKPILCRDCRLLGSANSCPKHKAAPIQPAINQDVSKAAAPVTPRIGPGDDFEAEGEPGADEAVKRAARAHKVLAKRFTELLLSRQVDRDYRDNVLASVSVLADEITRVAKAPPHVPEPPRQGSCKYCKGVVLWCETPTYKRIPLDVERCRGGRYDLIANVATRIEKSEQPAYMSHFLTCSKRPQK